MQGKGTAAILKAGRLKNAELMLVTNLKITDTLYFILSSSRQCVLVASKKLNDCAMAKDLYIYS